MDRTRAKRQTPNGPAGAGQSQVFKAVAFQILDGQADRILKSAALIEASRDPEGPHQFRVGLRRWRTAVHAFKLAEISAEVGDLADVARTLAREAGALRDLDVIAARYVAPAARENPHDAGFRSLLAELKHRRAAARTALIFALEQKSARRFFRATRQGFGADVEMADRDGAVADFAGVAAQALQARWRACRKRAQDVAGLSARDLHKLRKSVKKLRYLVEFVGPYVKSPSQAEFIACLKALQEVMGDLNDAAVAEVVLGPLGRPGAILRPQQRAARRILQDNSEIARGLRLTSEALWRKLDAQGPFWRG